MKKTIALFVFALMLMPNVAFADTEEAEAAPVITNEMTEEPEKAEPVIEETNETTEEPEADSEEPDEASEAEPAAPIEAAPPIVDAPTEPKTPAQAEEDPEPNLILIAYNRILRGDYYLLDLKIPEDRDGELICAMSDVMGDADYGVIIDGGYLMLFYIEEEEEPAKTPVKAEAYAAPEPEEAEEPAKEPKAEPAAPKAPEGESEESAPEPTGAVFAAAGLLTACGKGLIKLLSALV